MRNAQGELVPGLYERVVDRGLSGDITSPPATLHDLDAATSHEVLAAYLADVLAPALARADGSSGKVAAQVDLCNRILDLLAKQNVADDANHVAEPAKQLLRIDGPVGPPPIRPTTPLSRSWLFTGSTDEPLLGSELQKEFESSDRVDILCAFISWSGIVQVRRALKEFADRGGRLRVVTTTWLGATDEKAVDFLSKLPGAEVRISYDESSTRLHAKAYMFHRDTGYGAAYIGSSNLSRAALTDGMEWNLRISQSELGYLWAHVTQTFGAWWAGAEAERFEPSKPEKLRAALARAGKPRQPDSEVFLFDLKPHGFQESVLDLIAADRDAGRTGSLVVAATGTGKTVIAAFDYLRFRTAETSAGRRARLLFLAHREEILRQALYTFRTVLHDQNFGELLGGGYEAERRDHLFCTIQSWHSRDLAALPRDWFDYVVVDEFHHAEARTYVRLLDYIRPRYLLGLTATPERADGLDVTRWFDGRFTAEIRLPDAVSRGLLAPFHYYGVSDSVDLSGVAWKRGGYDAVELDRLYGANEQRADLVLRKTQDYLTNIHAARGIGFCVSKRHADFMAGAFARAGVPAVALTSDSALDVRRTIQRRLVERDINFIFTVDLYNEGVDIPEMDTALMLRPTESLTVFLQQLGRGLRTCEGKSHLTVLDFVGQCHKQFRWDQRVGALATRTGRRIDEEIDQGTLHVPVNCLVQFEEQAQRYVLENIRAAVRSGRKALVARIAEFEQSTGRPLTFDGFLDHHRLEPADLYAKGATWSGLCEAAGIPGAAAVHEDGACAKGLERLSHVSGHGQIERLVDLLTGAADVTGIADERLVVMLGQRFGWMRVPGETPGTFLARLRSEPAVVAELNRLLSWNAGRAHRNEPVGVAGSTLELYARYTREEALAALGYLTLDSVERPREGVIFVKEDHTYAFFVTLEKGEAEFSPTTRYEDYVIDRNHFHWQSQSTTRPESPTGQRFIHHVEEGITVLLFVRRSREDMRGDAMPFYCLGRLTYESHTGSRPMSIIWRLEHELPGWILTELPPPVAV